MARAIAAAVVVVSGLLVASCQASSVNVAFNLYDASADSYLVDATNVKLQTEFTGARYWTPYVYSPSEALNHWGSGVEGTVTYGFPLPFSAQGATIFAATAVFEQLNRTVYARLEVSPDAVNWTPINSNEQVDISSIVHDSSEVFLRARLYEDSPLIIVSQFLRSVVDGPPTLTLSASGNPIPEPSSVVLLAVGLLALSLFVLRRPSC